ncbi:MAG: DUF1572 domain-containing protein [Acidobacteriota bacterium]|nr:DUF1572 domain-containing protein [Acidobacteriota bacterium]
MKTLDRLFLSYSSDTLKRLSSRIADCLSRLTYEQVWTRSGDHDNSIGNLVLHLCGNVEQWIGTGIGGHADTRNRDAEFAAREGHQPAELAAKLNATIAGATAILLTLDAAMLLETRQIQKYDVTVLEAVYHVVEHFGEHTGQILFATKLLTGQDLGYYKHLAQAAAHGEKLP